VAKFKLLGGYRVATPSCHLALVWSHVNYGLRVETIFVTLINEYLWIFKEGYIPEYK
jgi:hypothetical protein